MKTITEKKYLKALKIVRAYHQQIEKEISEIPKKVENFKTKSKEDVEAGDCLECIEVHGNSTDNLTKGKRYGIVNTDTQQRSKYFTIITDKGTKRSYNCKNSQFKVV